MKNEYVLICSLQHDRNISGILKEPFGISSESLLEHDGVIFASHNAILLHSVQGYDIYVRLLSCLRAKDHPSIVLYIQKEDLIFYGKVSENNLKSLNSHKVQTCLFS